MINFLNPKIESFALDISDLSLKIVNLKKIRKSIKLLSFKEIDVPSGIIEQGEIKNEESLSKIIRQLVSSVEGKKLNTKYTIVSLPEEKSFLQVIKLPKMAGEELSNAVRFEAENYIPLPINEAYFDFRIIQSLRPNNDHLDILIGAIPKKIADSYVASVKMADLIPVSLEIESQAISRALIKNGVNLYPVLLVDLGATRTSFIVYSGSSIRFTASIPVTSHQFTNTISQSLNIDLNEAEILKKRYGLENREKVSFRKKLKGIEFEKEFTKDKRILDALVPSIIDFTKEIKKYLSYYQTHQEHEHLQNEKNEPVKEILLCGGGANLKGLARILSVELDIPVTIGNPWINVFPKNQEEVSNFSFEKSLSFTTAIGLALGGLNQN